jgi:hypothetical protein
MFFVNNTDERPDGYVVLTESSKWVIWLNRNIPPQLDLHVRRRLTSNLKHLLVGLELKAELIKPHNFRGPGERPVLFEPYFQNFILEFCVGAFSVIEGLGSAHRLAQQGLDGSNAPIIARQHWLEALCAAYDETGEFGLRDDVNSTLAIRDLLHQDRLGAREDIDWHVLSYDGAFTPASEAIRKILQRNADLVPQTSNLLLGAAQS